MPLNFGSYALRVLSVVGGTGLAFWGIAFTWSMYRDPPPVLGVAALSVVVVASLLGVLFRRYPRLLVVPDDTEWGVLVARLLVGGAASYVLLAVVVYVVGFSAVVAMGRRVEEGDIGEGLAILALWVPLWALPFSASATAWWWTCRFRL